MNEVEKPNVVQNEDRSVTINRPGREPITILVPIPRTVRKLDDGTLIEGEHPAPK